MDEINTSSCLGFLKEIVVDRMIDGEVSVLVVLLFLHQHCALLSFPCSSTVLPTYLSMYSFFLHGYVATSAFIGLDLCFEECECMISQAVHYNPDLWKLVVSHTHS